MDITLDTSICVVMYLFVQKLLKLTNYFCSHGLVGYRKKENMEAFKPPYVGVYFNVDYIKNPKGTNYWRNRVLKVAKSVEGITLAINNKDDFQHEVNEYGLDFVPDDKPIVLARSLDNKKYIMKDEFS